MKKRKKYINGFEVHPIGIGTWLMGGGIYSDKTSYAIYGNEEKEIEAIKYSIQLGQNHIDTAQMYGAGHTEEIVGLALKEFKREQLFLASKLWKSHLKGDAILRAIEGMLLRLKTDYLDIVYLHGYWAEYEPLEYQLNGLKNALDNKMIRAIGVSNFTLNQLREAQSKSQYSISAIQNYYSLANRSWAPEDLLTYCRENHIAFVAAKPLERGVLLEEKWKHILESIAIKCNKTVSQVALAWLVNQENVHVIPKSSTKTHIEENIDSLFELSPQDQSFLNQTNTV